jgi:hypothetical protein
LAEALFFKASFFQGGPQPEFRLAGRHIGVGVEAGNVLADDLIGLVAFALLCARVPARYIPRRIEHKDAIILDGFNQEPKRIGIRVALRRNKLRIVGSGIVQRAFAAGENGEKRARAGVEWGIQNTATSVLSLSHCQRVRKKKG